MNTQYYELFRLDAEENWHLMIVRDARGGDGAGYRWRDLTWARKVDVVPPLEVDVVRQGVRRDFTIDIGAGAPVLSARAATAIRTLIGADAELIPTKVEGVDGEYFVLNVLSRVKCLDETRTQYVEKWTADSYRPDRAGEYKMLRGIVIDPTLAAGHNFFRLWGTASANVIASSAVKEAFERDGLTGAKFRNVCPDNA